MSVINLSQNNWWELSNLSHSKIYSYKDFLKEATIQLNKYHHKSDSEIYIIETITPIIEEDKFNQLCKLSKSLQDQYTSILTWHNSNKPSKLSSICKYGYLMPGDIIPSTGDIVCMRCGNYYGDGIYSSKFFDISSMYASKDIDYKIDCLVNLVIPGKVKFLKLNIRDDGLNVPYCGQYQYKYNTLALPDLSEIISGSNDYITPIFRVTLRPKNIKKYEKIYLKLFNSQKLYSLEYKPKFTKEQKENGIIFNHIFRDFYTINLNKLFEYKYNVVRHIFVLPLSLQNNNLFIKGTDNFINSLQQNKIIILYDKNSYKYHNDDLKNNLLKNKKYYGESLISAINETFDFVSKNNNNESHIINIIYLYINKPNNEDLTDVIKKYKPLMFGKNIIIKLIFINNKINKKLYYPIKGLLQNLTPYEEYYYELNDNSMTEVYDKIIIENNNIDDYYCNLYRTKYKIPMPFGGVNQGFIINLIENPYWDLDTYNKVLYKGEKIEYLNIDEEHVYINYNNEINIELAGKTVISLLAQFRNFIIINKERYERYHGLVTLLCEGIMKKLDNELDNKLVKGFNNRKLIKEFYYKIATLISDIKNLANVKIEGQWFKRLQKMKYAKKIIKRSKNVNKINIELNLETNSAEYLGLRLIKTSASEIESWLIKVDYISLDIFQVRNIYNNNELYKEIYDNKKEIITDILCLNNNKEVLAYTFTRNPYLYISSQKIALLVIAWVSSIEYIFNILRNKGNKKVINLYERIKLVYSLTEKVKKEINKDKNLIELLNKIIEQENFECYLTESYDISSICMILGILLTNKKIFKMEKYHRFAFSLISESIMRECRVYLRSNNKNNDQHIQEIININKSTNLNQYIFDINKTTRRTNNFYKKKYTNCTPYAVVSTLEFIERYHDNFDIKNMIIAFRENKISMTTFFEKHCQNGDKKETQVALFLQGMKYSKSKYRQNIKFDNPKKIIDDIVEEQIKIIKGKQLMEKQIKNRIQRRYLERLEKAQEYDMYHITPKLFTWFEISDLNNNRSKDDQLELLPSGLFKHHCCYPECPEYLKKFATQYDIYYGTRKGIMNHLKYQLILDNYVPSFHLISQNIIKNKKMTYEEYIRKMDLYFYNNNKLKIWYETLKYKEQHLRTIWSFYNKL